MSFPLVHRGIDQGKTIWVCLRKIDNTILILNCLQIHCERVDYSNSHYRSSLIALMFKWTKWAVFELRKTYLRGECKYHRIVCIVIFSHYCMTHFYVPLAAACCVCFTRCNFYNCLKHKVVSGPPLSVQAILSLRHVLQHCTH